MRAAPCPRSGAHGLGAAALLAMTAGLAAAAPTAPAATATATSPADAFAGGCSDACVHHHPHPLMRAIDSLAEKSDDPAAARFRLLEQVRFSPACYAADLSAEEYEDLLARTGLLPAGIDPTQRFFTQGPVWFGQGQQGPAGTARAAHMTYSFPDDNVSWGLASVGFGGPQPNRLNQMFTLIFGAGNVDRGREMVRQAFASWRRSSGVTYREVADDNSPHNGTTTRSASRGDIRIGGFPFTNPGGVLAYNVFPDSGSDMVFNTGAQGSFANSSNNYRYLRNVAAHEHGHGMGYIHAVPCNGLFLMEPSITLNFDMLTIDERRGAARNYGDRFAGNSNVFNAHDFGDLTSPTLRSVIEKDLSTNGQSGPLGSSNDWFRFSLSSAQPVSISAAPIGGVYIQGQQSFGCNGNTATVNASQAGNLNIELRTADGATIIQSANAAGPGQTETLNIASLPAGEYSVRIFDAGPNPTANQNVQLYDLTIRVDNAKAPPQAIAGVHKRCAANTNCFFMGNLNSRALDPTAFLTNSSYAWDLDGDGVFEVLNAPTTSRQYVSNGVYPVTLRVTDSNGMVATDTIEVTIHGATTTIAAVAPGAGEQGQSIPVTITGTNLKNLTSASMVSVSGPGVTVGGEPVPNALGTEVTGLVFIVAPGADIGPRDVTVSNDDGSATAAGAFTVEQGSPSCPADWDQDGQVNSNDISAYLSAWLGSVQNGDLIADFDQSGQVNSNDISAFLSAWLAAVQTGC